MKIDIRDVQVLWINLEEHTINRDSMIKMLDGMCIKNHSRTPGIRPNGYIGNSCGQPISHFMGVGLAHLEAMRKAQCKAPLLIIEDDAVLTDEYKPILEVPDDADALYLGVSKAGNPYGYKVSPEIARIFNVLTTHAILYLSDRYLTAAKQACIDCLFNQQIPIDMAMSTLMNQYNVYTTLKPYFYQADSRESANKWEALTNCSIKIY